LHLSLSTHRAGTDRNAGIYQQWLSDNPSLREQIPGGVYQPCAGIPEGRKTLARACCG